MSALERAGVELGHPLVDERCLCGHLHPCPRHLPGNPAAPHPEQLSLDMQVNTPA